MELKKPLVVIQAEGMLENDHHGLKQVFEAVGMFSGKSLLACPGNIPLTLLPGESILIKKLGTEWLRPAGYKALEKDILELEAEASNEEVAAIILLLPREKTPRLCAVLEVVYGFPIGARHWPTHMAIYLPGEVIPKWV